MALRDDSKASESITVRIPIEWMEQARSMGLGGNTAIIHAAMRLLLDLPSGDVQQSSGNTLILLDAVRQELDSLKNSIAEGDTLTLDVVLDAVRQELDSLKNSIAEGDTLTLDVVLDAVRQELTDRENEIVRRVLDVVRQELDTLKKPITEEDKQALGDARQSLDDSDRELITITDAFRYAQAHGLKVKSKNTIANWHDKALKGDNRAIKALADVGLEAVPKLLNGCKQWKTIGISS